MKSEGAQSLSQSKLFFWPTAVLLLLWADFVWTVRYEWLYNEQYSYGWLALFLTLYLVYLRISDRPQGRGGAFNVAGLVLPGVVFLAFNRIVLESNPGWRPALWLHALSIFAMTLGLLWRMGGWSWVRHFTPAFALMLFTVPWPISLENSVTGGLMGMVAAIVVEGMNLCGFYAEQSGNLIRLRSGWVGIEAACSGVRNFQSTLMSAWFVGELLRFSFPGRGLLLLLGGLASLLLNVVRTWILTWTTHRSGSSLTETIHDPVGHLVALIAFVVLILLAFALRRFFPRTMLASDTTRAETCPSPSPPRPALSGAVALSVIGVLLLGYVVAELWYYRTERSLPEAQAVTVDWQNLPFEYEFVEIAPAIRAQLKYSDGVQVEWVDPRQQAEWKVFFFSWTKGSVSPFIGVHNPETCMPASGFEKGAVHPPLIVGEPPHRIEFEATTFYFGDRPFHVYYSSWSDYWDAPFPFARTGEDRLRLAWSGRRLTNRRSLQIVIQGIADERTARREVEGFLAEALRWPE